jgi:hypothetical protein
MPVITRIPTEIRRVRTNTPARAPPTAAAPQGPEKRLLQNERSRYI